MTLIGQSIAMIIFVWFCMKLIWPPIMNAIEERQTQIADGLAAAERGQQSLGKAQVEAKEIVQEARKQATSIVDQAHTWANELTAQGKRLATASRRRHEIVFSFLKSLGISDAVALTDSEGIEHHVSTETLKAFRRYVEREDRKDSV